MRISDWSSDVCSSDLARLDREEDAEHHDHHQAGERAEHGAERRGDAPDGAGQIVGDRLGIDLEIAHAVGACPGGDTLDLRHHDLLQRSEEHTSELQSLMRISYAVFCLKKKN